MRRMLVLALLAWVVLNTTEANPQEAPVAPEAVPAPAEAAAPAEGEPSASGEAAAVPPQAAILPQLLESGDLAVTLSNLENVVGPWRWAQPDGLPIIQDIGEKLGHAFLAQGRADGAIRAFSAVARAGRDPVEYLYQLTDRLTAQEQTLLWPKGPYLCIEDFERADALPFDRVIDAQGREVKANAVELEGNNQLLRFSVGPSVRDGRSYFAYPVYGFKVSYRPFGLRVSVREDQPILTHVVLKLWLPEAKASEELRLTEAAAQQANTKVFDTTLWAQSLAQLTAQVSQRKVDNLAITNIGVDMPEGDTNTFWVDNIEVYLPANWQELKRQEFTAPDLSEVKSPEQWALAAKGGTAAGDANFQMLDALGYLGSTNITASDKIQYVFNNPAKSFQGYTFYVSGHAPAAYLIDMDGNVLHHWEAPLNTVFPDDEAAQKAGARMWRRAYLYNNGDVLAIYQGFAIARFDKDSKLLWARKGGYHHAAHIQEDGAIYTLMSQPEVLPRINEKKNVFADYIVVLAPDGTEIKRIPILDSFENSYYTPLFYKRLESAGDILHTNSIHVLDGSMAGTCAAFKQGNILISVKYLECLAVVDPEQQKVVWSLSGMWLRQHEPIVLKNGNMMIFDNVGMWFSRRGGVQYSRVLEFNPFTQEVVWEYKGSRETPLFSKHCGSVQRLSNGNTLISETEGGRVFEVSPEKEIVWELHNPNRTGENNQLIAAIFEGVRLPPDFPIGWASPAPVAPVAAAQ
ncbi:MAG: hypothetical protein HYV26_23855 [Candidatus Hydrogenedentes bacterium]|nr:hypothetical protein [Candidatus Hydrogenedentota bacterium]